MDEEYDKRKNNNLNKFVSGYAATQGAIQKNDAIREKFAKPQSYTGNRTLYDDPAAKRKAKTDLFKDGKKVIDKYTGEELVLTVKEAKARFGEDWAKHLAETDHVISVHEVYENNKNNAWVTNDNIREMANDSSNLNVTARAWNNEKRDKKQKDFVNSENRKTKMTEEGEKEAIEDIKKSQGKMAQNKIKNVATNIADTVHSAGKDGAGRAGISVATTSTITNMVAVIKGEKEPEEAIEDCVKETGMAAVRGYVQEGGMVVVMHSLENCKSELIRTLSKSNVVGNVCTAVSVTFGTIKSYCQGEITLEECFLNLGKDGVTFAVTTTTGAIGTAIGAGISTTLGIMGGAIGVLIGSVLVNGLYEGMMAKMQQRQLEYQERARIREECERAKKQLIAYRQELERYLSTSLREYRECFKSALSSLSYSFEIGDVDGAAASANEIANQFGTDLKYKTLDEFEQYFMSE